MDDLLKEKELNSKFARELGDTFGVVSVGKRWQPRIGQDNSPHVVYLWSAISDYHGERRVKVWTGIPLDDVRGIGKSQPTTSYYGRVPITFKSAFIATEVARWHAVHCNFCPQRTIIGFNWLHNLAKHRKQFSLKRALKRSGYSDSESASIVANSLLTKRMLGFTRSEEVK